VFITDLAVILIVAAVVVVVVVIVVIVAIIVVIIVDVIIIVAIIVVVIIIVIVFLFLVAPHNEIFPDDTLSTHNRGYTITIRGDIKEDEILGLCDPI
jgi:hypothetical protein